MKKIILLNAGKKTRESFQLGLQHTTIEYYRTKETLLHIKKDTSVSFINHNRKIDFTDSYVFTRLRANDEVFTGIVYEHLKALGVPAIDEINISFPMSGEKIAQMARLARAAIPIPETIIAREESFAINREYIMEHLQFPLVYKTDGNKGKNVYKIDSFLELEEKISKKRARELFIMQQLIPNTFDTRTLVAFNTILGTIQRSAPAGSFLNNVSQGGTASAYSLTEEEKQIAITATRASQLDFGGVDIIHTNTGPYVIEVNKAPQIGGFESIYGERSVFKAIARLIEEKY